jgi:23S rRNA (adenine-N6)-dimethyltransferase
VSEAKRTPRDERRRRLGQNFLRPDVAKALVTGASFQPDDLVVEIGAGLGSCTLALAHRVEQVVAIEVDRDLAGQLRQAVERRNLANVSVLRLDALDYRFPTRPFRVFGSLPFGSTTALLRHLFDDPSGRLIQADLVVQWEVARKRTAVPPTTLLSATWTPWWVFDLDHRIQANAFRPMPVVDAALLRVTRRSPPLLPVHLAAAYGKFVREHWNCS